VFYVNASADVPLSLLQESAATALQLADRDPQQKTGALRLAAESIVEAREHFFDQDGRPDWAGRTYAYRQWMRETQSRAGNPPSTLMASVRYHISNVLRERVSAEDLEEAGLHTSSAREKGAVRREERSLRASLLGAGPEITDADDIVDVLRAMETTLQRIRPDERASSNPTDVHRISTVAARVAGLADGVLATGRRGPRG
jgi:hypothetical protein